MGYCYDHKNRLCCDVCGTSGGVRKYKCPFGYCQPIAACEKCRKDKRHLFLKPYHQANGCETGHQKFVAWQEEKQQMLAEGKRVRISALGTKENGVHVLFQDRFGNVTGYYIEPFAYDKIPVGANATPEMFMKYRHIFSAPSSFYGGKITKQV